MTFANMLKLKYAPGGGRMRLVPLCGQVTVENDWMVTNLTLRKSWPKGPASS